MIHRMVFYIEAMCTYIECITNQGLLFFSSGSNANKTEEEIYVNDIFKKTLINKFIKYEGNTL